MSRTQNEMGNSPERTNQQRIPLALFDIGAVDCIGYHELKLHEENPEAPLSPIFMNLRTPENPKPGPLTPEIVDDIAALFFEYVTMYDIQFDFVVGIPNAGEPFAEAFCKPRQSGDSILLKLHKMVEVDGKRRIGTLTADSMDKIFHGAKVLVFDDLITKAHSKLEAAEALEISGLKVTDFVVLVDREQGGSKEMAERGYAVHAMYPLSWLLEEFLQCDRINQEKYDEINAYLVANS
jgi:orotate phosphoribosyltransferase